MTTGQGPAAVRKAVGAYGERLAVRHLVEAGMQVVDRNWRCPLGEIDIVALDGDELVICEVKTRRSMTYGSPIEAITRAKAARLRRLAGAWIGEHADIAARTRDVRIDVVGILRPRRGASTVEHLAGVA